MLSLFIYKSEIFIPILDPRNDKSAYRLTNLGSILELGQLFSLNTKILLCASLWFLITAVSLMKVVFVPSRSSLHQTQ